MLNNLVGDYENGRRSAPHGVQPQRAFAAGHHQPDVPVDDAVGLDHGVACPVDGVDAVRDLEAEQAERGLDQAGTNFVLRLAGPARCGA